jgi:hypothetical protein
VDILLDIPILRLSFELSAFTYDLEVLPPTLRLVNLIPKPIQDIGVNTDGDTCFAGRGLYQCAAFSMVKIIFFFAHKLSS